MTEPLEIERKYLIAMPELSRLDALCTEKLRLRQIYLLSAEGSRRIRHGEWPGGEKYWYTEKRRVTAVTRIEREREISAEEFAALEREADPARRPIEKTRWRIPYAGHVLEIDVFPFWQRQAVCEVELGAEDEAAALPPWLTVLREVTADSRYTNSALAVSVPEEGEEEHA